MVRHKNRYIIFIINEQNTKEEYNQLSLNNSNLYKAILERLEQLHGDFGVAACRTGFVAKYCNKETRVAIIRVRHGPHRLVTSTLPLINEIEKKKAKITILYVGATMQKCFQFLKKYQEQKFEQFSVNLKTVEEKEYMKMMLMNLSSIENMMS